MMVSAWRVLLIVLCVGVVVAGGVRSAPSLSLLQLTTEQPKIPHHLLTDNLPSSSYTLRTRPRLEGTFNLLKDDGASYGRTATMLVDQSNATLLSLACGDYWQVDLGEDANITRIFVRAVARQPQTRNAQQDFHFRPQPPSTSSARPPSPPSCQPRLSIVLSQSEPSKNLSQAIRDAAWTRILEPPFDFAVNVSSRYVRIQLEDTRLCRKSILNSVLYDIDEVYISDDPPPKEVVCKKRAFSNVDVDRAYESARRKLLDPDAPLANKTARAVAAAVLAAGGSAAQAAVAGANAAALAVRAQAPKRPSKEIAALAKAAGKGAALLPSLKIPLPLSPAQAAAVKSLNAGALLGKFPLKIPPLPKPPPPTLPPVKLPFPSLVRPVASLPAAPPPILYGVRETAGKDPPEKTGLAMPYLKNRLPLWGLWPFGGEAPPTPAATKPPPPQP
eukprot:gnl/Spiro4/23942_TR11855_c0_g1_i1.p1 gnl/Spiro4/23942_TR11855_c0_g1~~gnl/Spiro4/23942_TR11855_c0_g1_i1.p1  ORF type:complete len:445 (-),score=76.20 gnl/Spiro4/23942_TR11855_c0_g1_i1:48-1382(-)